MPLKSNFTSQQVEEFHVCYLMSTLVTCVGCRWCMIKKISMPLPSRRRVTWRSWPVATMRDYESSIRCSCESIQLKLHDIMRGVSQLYNKHYYSARLTFFKHKFTNDNYVNLLHCIWKLPASLSVFFSKVLNFPAFSQTSDL